MSYGKGGRVAEVPAGGEKYIYMLHTRVVYLVYRDNNKQGAAACYLAVLFFFFTHIYFPASGQAVVTGVVPSPPPVLAFNFYRA